MAKHSTVDDYLAAMPTPLREAAESARGVIDKHLKGAESSIKWAHPTWSIGKKPVCYLKAASKHVTFGSGAAPRSTIRRAASRPPVR